VFSCHFGNYRNELENYSQFQCQKNIDYFLFTDDKHIQLDGWKIYETTVFPSNEIMDGNRWTSKYIKFVLPTILKSYDIIIWIDSKNVHKLYMTSDMVYNIFQKYPESKIFNIMHPERKSVQEELEITIKKDIENKLAGQKFLNMVKDIQFNFHLPDTSFIIRKNTTEINKIFEYCFELMKKYKLKRDQNVYNYAFYKKNIVPTILFDTHPFLS
jgi:hypothetical protein